MNLVFRKTAIATFVAAAVISAPALAPGEHSGTDSISAIGASSNPSTEGTGAAGSEGGMFVASSEVPSAPNASMGIASLAQIPVASSEFVALPNVQAAR